MASKQQIERMLQAYARNYGKSDHWVGDVLPLWFGTLKPYRDEDVSRVGRQIMAKKARMPTVAVFLEVLRADPQTVVKTAAEGCAACSGSGWREVAWHRWKDGKLMVTTYAAGCDCEKGRRYVSGAARHWADVVNDYKNDPSTKQVFYTSVEKPSLTMEERYHPAIVKRLSMNPVERF